MLKFLFNTFLLYSIDQKLFLMKNILLTLSVLLSHYMICSAFGFLPVELNINYI